MSLCFKFRKAVKPNQEMFYCNEPFLSLKPYFLGLACVPGSRREKKRGAGVLSQISVIARGWQGACFPVTQPQKDPAARLGEQSTAPTALACMESCECHLHFPALKHHKSTIKPQKIYRGALDGAKMPTKGAEKKKTTAKSFLSCWGRSVDHLTPTPHMLRKLLEAGMSTYDLMMQQHQTKMK